MYGPASMSGGGGGGRGFGGPPKERTFTPRGQMSAGANQKAPLQDLPPHLRAMFEPNPPLQLVPPEVKPESKPYTGISQYTTLFETTPPPLRDPFEPPLERKKRIKDQLAKLNQEKNELMMSDWKPQNNPKATENAYNTLFVGRLSYDTNEKKLKREFEQYGEIKDMKLVTNILDGKPRGYAFIEYVKEADVATAYKKADGKKLDGRRIVVDVERGRTVRNWKPRRFGSGLGGRKALLSKKTLEEDAKKLAAGGSSLGSSSSGSSALSSSSSSRPCERPSGGGDGSSSSRGTSERDRSDRDRGGDRGVDSRYAPSSTSSSGGVGSERDRDRERRDRDRGSDRGGGGDRDGGGGASKYGPGLGYVSGSSISSGAAVSANGSGRRSRSRDRGGAGGVGSSFSGGSRVRTRSPEPSDRDTRRRY